MNHLTTRLSVLCGIQPIRHWIRWNPSNVTLMTTNNLQQLEKEATMFMYKTPLKLTLNVKGIQESATIEELQDTIPRNEDTLFDLIICINMIHISPWEATIGLMKIAKDHLSDGGIVYCYGPYKENGTAVESNLNFDRSLKSRDPSWGVRDLETVVEVAKEEGGLELVEKIEMPANNLSLIFQKR